MHAHDGVCRLALLPSQGCVLLQCGAVHLTGKQGLLVWESVQRQVVVLG